MMENDQRSLIQASIRTLRNNYIVNQNNTIVTVILKTDLTMAPFISLNTTPLKSIGESGLDRSSGSNRQPSCLVQEICGCTIWL